MRTTKVRKHERKLKSVYCTKSTNLTTKAKEQIGVTFDAKEAGYILSDGSMLDFTGRFYATGYERKILPTGETIFVPKIGQPDYLKGTRNLDHREISHIFPLPISGDEAMIKFEHESNALRFHLQSSGELNISLTTAQNITLAQWDRLNKIQHSTRGVVFFDIYDGTTQNMLESGEVKNIAELRRKFESLKRVKDESKNGKSKQEGNEQNMPNM